VHFVGLFFVFITFFTTDFDWRERKFMRSWVGKPKGTRPPGTNGLRFEYYIKVDLKGIWSEVVNSIHLV